MISGIRNIYDIINNKLKDDYFILNMERKIDGY